MARRNSSNPSVRKDAANLAQLRAMTQAERDKRTCGQCQVTYRSPASVTACQRWHAGK